MNLNCKKPEAEILKLESTSKSPGRVCQNTDSWAAPPNLTLNKCRLGPWFCISNKFLDEADALGHTLRCVILDEPFTKFKSHTNHRGILLKCRFRYSRGSKFCLLTSSQIMLMLLICGSYFEHQISRQCIAHFNCLTVWEVPD